MEINKESEHVELSNNQGVSMNGRKPVLCSLRWMTANDLEITANIRLSYVLRRELITLYGQLPAFGSRRRAVYRLIEMGFASQAELSSYRLVLRRVRFDPSDYPLDLADALRYMLARPVTLVVALPLDRMVSVLD